MSDERKRDPDDPQGMSGWHKVVLGAIVFVLVGSIAARAALAYRDGGREGLTAAGGSALATGFVDGDTTTDAGEPEPEGLERFLPFLTEGSLFALIGFALGYTTRKLFKLLLIGIALFFIGIQVLAYYDIAEVDWGGVLGWINGLILNLKENETVTEVLTHRVPTAGALVAGYVLGFRRG